METRPCDLVLANRRDIEACPEDHDRGHDEPWNPTLPGCDRLRFRRFAFVGGADRKFRFGRRLPDLQEEQGADERAERGEDVG